MSAVDADALAGGRAFAADDVVANFKVDRVDRVNTRFSLDLEAVDLHQRAIWRCDIDGVGAGGMNKRFTGAAGTGIWNTGLGPQQVDSSRNDDILGKGACFNIYRVAAGGHRVDA